MRERKLSFWIISILATGWIVPIITQDNFYFSIQPSSPRVLEKHSVTLECSVSDTKNIVYSWTINGETFLPTTRRYQNGSNLRITRVDRELDKGEFRCIAMNTTTGFSLSSLQSTVTVLWISDTAKVQLQVPESNEQVKIGVELVLRCKAEGNPDVQVEWYRNSVRVFRNDRVSLRNRRLHITNISAWDNGVYSCRVVNEAGAVDSTENFVLKLPHDQAAKIIKLPEDVTVKRFDSTRFDCVFENALVVEWYARDGGPLGNSSRITVFPNGSLFINPVKVADEGLYKCVGIRGIVENEPVQTFIAELKIAKLDAFTEDSFEPKMSVDHVNVVPEEKEFEVTCIIPRGFPTPQIWWEGPDGKVVSENGRIRVDGSRLLVENAKKIDSGNYTCVAENMAGSKRSHVQLYVTTPPVVITNPISQYVDEGNPAMISCSFSGSPYPFSNVQWEKDNRPLKSDVYHVNVYPHNGTLFITDVQLSDAGDYACHINTSGFKPVKSATAKLYVKEKLKFVPVPVDRKLELGSKSRIYCRASGSTKPVVHWRKEGHPFFKWPEHIHDENGTLLFESVQYEDVGKYTCFATSSQGIINATIQVDVIVTPKFLVKPTNTEAYEGYPVMLHCQVYGDPQPTILWDKNNKTNGFDQQRFTVIENGSLFVQEVHMDDQGRYGCTAGNRGGLKREEVSLVVKSSEGYKPHGDLYDAKGEKKEESMMTKTVTITLGAAAAYMILVIGLMIWCRYRRAKRKAAYLQQSAAEGILLNKTENGDVNHDGELKEREPAREYRDIVKSDGEAQSQSSGHSHHSKRSRTSYDRLQFPRHDLQTIMLLGKGEFGDVLLAKAHGIRDGEQDTLVMIKVLQSHEEQAHFDFKRELDTYHKINHDNVAKLLGVCKEAEPFFMIMEYSDWGDLKQFLLATRKDNPRKSPRPPQPNTSGIVSMALQVATGMEYLTNHRFIHRDIAARNCLVTSKLDIKISNPCLSRDTYANEYMRLHNRPQPIRWMPAEAVFDDDVSAKSDAYAFAVLVWETFSQAELPFADKSDDEFCKALQNKEISWQIPEKSKCPQELHELLIKCWSINPKDRPSFSEIVVRIGEISIDSNV